MWTRRSFLRRTSRIIFTNLVRFAPFASYQRQRLRLSSLRGNLASSTLCPAAAVPRVGLPLTWSPPPRPCPSRDAAEKAAEGSAGLVLKEKRLKVRRLPHWPRVLAPPAQRAHAILFLFMIRCFGVASRARGAVARVRACRLSRVSPAQFRCPLGVVVCPCLHPHWGDQGAFTTPRWTPIAWAPIKAPNEGRAVAEAEPPGAVYPSRALNLNSFLLAELTTRTNCKFACTFLGG